MILLAHYHPLIELCLPLETQIDQHRLKGQRVISIMIISFQLELHLLHFEHIASTIF